MNNIGTTTIKVADAKNPVYSNTSRASVLPPEDLQLIPNQLEVEVGNNVVIPIAVSAFTDIGMWKVRECI